MKRHYYISENLDDLEHIEQELEAAQQHDASRITGITVAVGDLANISDDALRFNFEVLSRGSLAEGAAVTVNGEDRPVCCAGCRAVARAIGDAGLTDYYRFRTELPGKGETLVPAADEDELEFAFKRLEPPGDVFHDAGALAAEQGNPREAAEHFSDFVVHVGHAFGFQSGLGGFHGGNSGRYVSNSAINSAS